MQTHGPASLSFVPSAGLLAPSHGRPDLPPAAAAICQWFAGYRAGIWKWLVLMGATRNEGVSWW